MGINLLNKFPVIFKHHICQAEEFKYRILVSKVAMSHKEVQWTSEEMFPKDQELSPPELAWDPHH
jgi:hypothetical protein